MPDLADHDADPGDHDRPIPVITMDRSGCSRSAETRTPAENDGQFVSKVPSPQKGRKATRPFWTVQQRAAYLAADKVRIDAAMTKTGGNRVKAAEQLGMSYRTLLYKLKEIRETR
jgi:DNA-binding NtrC family response regulator